MRKKLTALFLAVAILFTYFPSVKAAGSVWFIAVNDSVPMTLTRETEPFYSDDILYIPYTVFRASPFGVNSSYNEDKKENLTLFNRVKRLHFDLKNEIVTDKEGNTSKVNVIFKNGVLYLPANRLVHFNIDVRLLQNPDGYYVLRLTNGAQNYDDDVLLAMAEQLIKYQADRYDDGTLQPETDIPGVQTPDDGNGYDPEEEPEGYAYVAFHGDAVSELSVKLLETMDVLGAFFLTEEQIRRDPALVRMMYAAGNTIGLTVTEGEENVQASLDAANAALDDIIFRKSILVLLPEKLAFQTEGYRVLITPDESVSEAENEQPAEIPEETEEPQSQFLVVSEANIANTLSKLQQDKIRILQIRESSSIT